MIITDYREIFKLDKAILDEVDPEIHKLLLFWKSDEQKITVQTSGSTGNPKKINISKKQMTISAEATLKHFNINKNSNLIDIIGDIAISRRDMAPAYHLAVVIDDMEQNITHVVRGEDLRPSTIIHVVLQRLLGLTTPFYIHHPLINDENGKRLAKRNDAKSISTFRSQGASPLDIRHMIGL